MPISRRILILCLAAWLLVPTERALAAGEGAAQNATQQGGSSKAPPPASAPDRQLGSESSDQHIAELIASSNERLSREIAAVRPSPADKWLPAIFGVAGTLLAAAIAAAAAIWLQKQKLAYDRKAAERATADKAMAEIMAFRGRQLNEFYAPLEALLRQSLVLRDEFYDRLLAKDAPAGIEFQWREDPLASTGRSLWMTTGPDTCSPFRLIDQMGFLYTYYTQLMPNVGEVVRIGDLVVAHVHARIGLVRHDSSELNTKLGIYLAHQSVLKEVYENVVSSKGTVSPAGYTAAYPRGLDKLVQADCQVLRDELAEWEKTVSQWIVPGTMAPGSLMSRWKRREV